MKIKRELIETGEDSSFRLLLTPMLNDLYYWHFHPECEIVYVEAEEGIRHIGEHISRYTQSDLVLIGPNIPHLNFDYGVAQTCEQVVVQFRESMFHDAIEHMPEFQTIGRLFERARKGIAFNGRTKETAANLLKELSGLREFERILHLFRIFQLLSISEDYTLLDASPIVDAREERDMNRLQKVYQFLEENYTVRIDIGEVAKAVHLSTPAFCRFFKKQSGITFTQFVNQFRISRSRKLLLQQKTVTEACYASGFDNLSYFNRTFKKITGENPSHFRRKFAAG